MESTCRDCAITAQSAAPGETTAPGENGAAPMRRERRMQLRAYNHWASMLDRRRFPSVADLASGALGDIAHHSVLLDVSAGAESPAIAYLGEGLAWEGGTDESSLQRLNDAPEGSLLARLCGHYQTVLVNRAPTGFEAEFTGLRGATVLYRGILLPFSSDDTTIDFVLAVINWKEVAEAQTAMTAREASVGNPYLRRMASPAALITDWADGPGSPLGGEPDPSLATLEGTPHAPAADEAPLPGEAPDHTLPPALLEGLRMLPAQPFAALPAAGAEFALVMIRRSEHGPAALLGEVPFDPRLIAQAVQLLAR